MKLLNGIYGSSGFICMTRGNKIISLPSDVITSIKQKAGLGTVAAIQEMSDLCYTISIPALLANSSAGIKKDRADARQGALALVDLKMFAKNNIYRYKNIILVNKIKNTDIDTSVKRVISDLSTIIMNAINAKDTGEYGNVIIKGWPDSWSKGLERASRQMGDLLDKYAAYIKEKNALDKRRARVDIEPAELKYYEEDVKRYEREVVQVIKDVEAIIAKVHEANK